MSSKCKQCGDDIVGSGNYTFKIIPARRIPKKARKLMVKARKDVPENSAEEATSFQKFLMKRAKPTNHIELTCGKCGALSRIKMLKPDDPNILASQNTSTSEDNTMKAKTSKKRKRTKDKTAGLTIPASSSNTASKATTPSKPLAKSEKTSLPSTNRPPVPIQLQQNAKKSPFQKQKDMDKLKKILFDSKKAKKSGSSLQDFLSSI